MPELLTSDCDVLYVKAMLLPVYLEGQRKFVYYLRTIAVIANSRVQIHHTSSSTLALRNHPPPKQPFTISTMSRLRYGCCLFGVCLWWH